MEKEQLSNIVDIRIQELEEKLMDLIELLNNYPDVPVPIFEQEIDEILKEIEYLNDLSKL